jgi:MFS family permease
LRLFPGGVGVTHERWIAGLQRISIRKESRRGGRCEREIRADEQEGDDGMGDRYGRRRLYAAGLGLLAAASAACALAPGVGWLIAARAAQGAGSALLMPLGLALLSAAFPPERRGAAIGIFSAITGLAVASGPLVGGAIIEGISWEWILAAFTDGFAPAIGVAAGLALAGAFAGLALPVHRRATETGFDRAMEVPT